MKIDEAVDHAYDYCNQWLTEHENERYQLSFLRALFNEDDDREGEAWGAGFATLIIGVANQGAMDDGDLPEDPAGEAWEGTRARSGKHWIDGGTKAPYGGLGICHLDSSGLYEDAYIRFGEPYAGALEEELHFNALLGSKHRSAYLKWADNLLESREFHHWLVRLWLKEFWSPVWEWTGTLGLDRVERVRLAAVNARIANSVKGVAKGIRKSGEKDYRKHIERYVDYKMDKRGERSAARAQRQADQALRVGVLFEHLYTRPFD